MARRQEPHGAGVARPYKAAQEGQGTATLLALLAPLASAPCGLHDAARPGSHDAQSDEQPACVWQHFTTVLLSASISLRTPAVYTLFC